MLFPVEWLIKYRLATRWTLHHVNLPGSADSSSAFGVSSRGKLRNSKKHDWEFSANHKNMDATQLQSYAAEHRLSCQVAACSIFGLDYLFMDGTCEEHGRFADSQLRYSWWSTQVVLNLSSTTPPLSNCPLFQPPWFWLSKLAGTRSRSKAFHVVERVRARAPCKFIDATLGRSAPQLATTDLLYLAQSHACKPVATCCPEAMVCCLYTSLWGRPVGLGRNLCTSC